ncbi:hypothetical protein TNCV_1613101 [Trichonephila clavipes]|nr:hypothetical protein TNCV_1613101 [Trichonephila clavipes]
MIIGHGPRGEEVTRTTPELASLSPNYRTTPWEAIEPLDKFKVHQLPLQSVSSMWHFLFPFLWAEEEYIFGATDHDWANQEDRMGGMRPAC